MNKRNRRAPATWILPFSSILFTAVLLAVGLWPFNPFPRNKVTWLPGELGVRIGEPGIIYSKYPLDLVQPQTNSFCTLAIRLQPHVPYLHGSGTLMSLYTPGNPQQFRLMQWRDELLIRKDYRDVRNRFKTIELELEHFFIRNEPASLIVTAGPSGTVAYRNDARAGVSAGMGFSCADLSGQLVMGNSAVSDNPWRGKLFDLAIYNQQLAPRDVAGVYASSNAASQQSPFTRNIIIRYTFAEGSGDIIHNSAGSAPDLYIPKVFRMLHKKMMMWPWEENRDKLTVHDIVINIVGFMPFGLLLFAYLNWRRHWNRAAMVTILAGASISLTIEILQGFIPARDSGMLDIISNTLGTALGVLLFRWFPIQALTEKFLTMRPTRENHPGN